MIKTTFAGALLFIIMVVIAMSVSPIAPTENGRSGDTSFSMQQQQSDSILQSARPIVVHNGEDGGLEDNPLVVMVSIALILCFAVAFWKYHHILEQRQADEVPVKKNIRSWVAGQNGAETKQKGMPK
jgi:hypothetical protein